MNVKDTTYPGRRISYDGALCTVRCEAESIQGTKGAWLGVEWDNPERGKHNGTHAGVTYFECRSTQPKIASFVRPTRKPDAERTVLEAIGFKYVSNTSPTEAVVISGKVAQEIGFDKIIKEQSVLADLRLVVLDHLCVSGVAPRGSSRAAIEKAQAGLAEACPNIVELDLGHNPIETWAQIEDICAALPKLRILKLNCIRLRDFKSSEHSVSPSCMLKVEELHLNECLLRPPEILQILQGSGTPRLKSLQSLWLSQNELSMFDIVQTSPVPSFRTVKTLMLENNFFTSLDPIPSILSVFPDITDVSFQSNKISSFGIVLSELTQVPSYTSAKSLNLSQNNITSWSFVDLLPQVFPALSSFRISRNPLYDGPISSSTPAAKQTDTSYYLTLARIPTLQHLNHAKITTQEREEGEIYFLSVAEKDIRATLTTIDPANPSSATQTTSALQKKYPCYAPLCHKHDHDNLLTQYQSLTSLPNLLPSNPTPAGPPGSLLSRLVTSTFYIPPSEGNKTFTRALPTTIATSSVFALVSRTLSLPSLRFSLVYESDELEPSRADTTTRSQMERGAHRWDDWGDWDADKMVESGNKEEGDRWVDGVLVRNGKRWRKREVRVLFGARGWGEWLDQGVRTCRVRVEPVGEGDG